MEKHVDSLKGSPYVQKRSFFEQVLQPLKRLPHLGTTNLGNVQYADRSYPVLLTGVKGSHTKNKPNVLLSAGIHGDEPAGVVAVMDFLRNGILDFADRCNIFVLPCINPSGFEWDTRHTSSNVDINRRFGTGDKESNEVAFIEDWLTNFSHMVLSIDLHEDQTFIPSNEADGEPIPTQCYVYESVDGVGGEMGRKFLDTLSATEVCQWESIYGDNADRGLILEDLRTETDRRTNFDNYVRKHHSDVAVTLETPTAWSMPKRVGVHSQWIRRGIESVIGKS